MFIVRKVHLSLSAHTVPRAPRITCLVERHWFVRKIRFRFAFRKRCTERVLANNTDLDQYRVFTPVATPSDCGGGAPSKSNLYWRRVDPALARPAGHESRAEQQALVLIIVVGRKEPRHVADNQLSALGVGSRANRPHHRTVWSSGYLVVAATIDTDRGTTDANYGRSSTQRLRPLINRYAAFARARTKLEFVRNVRATGTLFRSGLFRSPLTAAA